MAVPACGLCHWGLRWSSLWGHEPCDGCAEMRGGPRMRSVPLGPSVELPVGPRTVRGVCQNEWQSPHATCAAGAFGGASCGATNRVRGVPKWAA
eukprot:4216176-Pyramimonas_sp.AAC.1